MVMHGITPELILFPHSGNYEESGMNERFWDRLGKRTEIASI